MNLDRHVLVAAIEELLRSTGTRPNAGQVGKALGLTEVQLRRRLRATNGPSVRVLTTTVCLNHAAALLREGIKVEAAPTLAGFRHYSNFIGQFRRQFGCSPSAFRAQSGAAGREEKEEKGVTADPPAELAHPGGDVP